MPRVTVIMYHYVRRTDESRYPRIHARRVDEFERQLDHVQANYQVISLRSYAHYLQDRCAPIPNNAAILSFDDGFKDHYSTVYPSLKRRKISGSFFPITEPLIDRTVASVHKTQFLLAHLGTERFAQDLECELAVSGTPSRAARPSGGTTTIPYRYDDGGTAALKNRIASLPADVKQFVLNTLFQRHITSNEADFVQELYLTDSEIQEMVAGGMDFGGHTHSHPRLSLLTESEQHQEILRSNRALEQILKTPMDLFAYPYGDHDDMTIRVLKGLGVTLALSTLVGVETEHQDPFRIRRLNTNDLPH